MPIFIVLSKLTDAGFETLKSKPERVKEVNKKLEKMSVKMLEQYTVFGEYDFVNIVEAKDNLTIMKAMVEMISRGTVRTITLPDIKVDDLIKELKNSFHSI